jgi:hypothetical protein
MLSNTGLWHRVRLAAHGSLIISGLSFFVAPSALAASSATLMWNPSSSTNIAGYKVYYGNSSRNYTNTITAGTATTITISNLVSGATYYFAATAYDTYNLESDFSNEVGYTNVVQASPLITLTSPANGSAFTAPANISLAANVTAHGHSITKVQFYSGTTLLGEDTSAPYVFSWNNVSVGSYSLTARLVYDTGSTLNSTPAVNVLVAAPKNEPPTISAIAAQTTTQDTPTRAIPFTISDAETIASNLTVYATSADPTLVPTNNIVFGGSDSVRTVTLTPMPGATGTVAITVFVSDGSLLTNTTFQLAVQPPAQTLTVTGDGTISSGLDTQTLIPGQICTVTAVPAAGQEFAGWCGSISSTNPRLTFVMSSNLVLQANFTPRASGRGAARAGNTYNGLFFEQDAIRLSGAGSFTLSVTPRGRYSGRIVLGARRYSFSGLLNTNQNTGTNLIARRDGPALSLAFQIDGSQNDQVSGQLTDGTWTSLLSGDLAVFGRTNPAPFAGSYTMVIPGYDGDPSLPAGNGFGSLRVTSAGLVNFAGTLADGTKASQSTTVSRAGYWPVYIPLYYGNGSLMSWLAFADNGTNDLGGNLTWIKQPGSLSKYYLGGFSCQCDAFGSRYLPTSSALNATNATLTFSGGDLTSVITNAITIGPGSKLAAASKALRMSFARSTGTFQGTYADAASGKRWSFGGAVFQKLNTGYGVLFGTGDQTSAVMLEP